MPRSCLTAEFCKDIVRHVISPASLPPVAPQAAGLGPGAGQVPALAAVGAQVGLGAGSKACVELALNARPFVNPYAAVNAVYTPKRKTKPQSFSRVALSPGTLKP